MCVLEYSLSKFRLSGVRLSVEHYTPGATLRQVLSMCIVRLLWRLIEPVESQTQIVGFSTLDSLQTDQTVQTDLPTGRVRLMYPSCLAHLYVAFAI